MDLFSFLSDVHFFERLTERFFIRLLIDLSSAFILIHFVYYKIYRKKDYFFTFIILNLLIFIITYLLNKADISLGAAFGLFAVFSMLRFRTESITMKDMTYLFTVIAIGLISAVSTGTYFELVILNLIIIALTYILDGNLLMKNELTQDIQYELIENIKPENYDILMADMKTRTGLDIHKVSVVKTNFLSDSALIRIYYYE